MNHAGTYLRTIGKNPDAARPLKTWPYAKGTDFIHLKTFDPPGQEEKLVITTTGVVRLGEIPARNFSKRP